MANSERQSVRIPEPLRAAMDEYCKTHGISVSQLILQAVAEKMGRQDLLSEVRPAHRPKGD